MKAKKKDKINIKSIMTDIIEKQFEKKEQSGIKIKLTSVIKIRWICTLIFGAVFLFLTLNTTTKNYDTMFACSYITIIIYYIIMYRANNVDVIIRKAKKNPDMRISDIIEGDIQQ